MSITLDYFKATQAQPVRTSPGRLTLEQTLGMFDALSGVFITCSHVFPADRRLESHEARLNALRQSGKLTVPQCQRILSDWYKWTFHPSCLVDGVPSLSSVLGFLSCVSVTSIAKL